MVLAGCHCCGGVPGADHLHDLHGGLAGFCARVVPNHSLVHARGAADRVRRLEPRHLRPHRPRRSGRRGARRRLCGLPVDRRAFWGGACARTRFSGRLQLRRRGAACVRLVYEQARAGRLVRRLYPVLLRVRSWHTGSLAAGGGARLCVVCAGHARLERADSARGDRRGGGRGTAPLPGRARSPGGASHRRSWRSWRWGSCRLVRSPSRLEDHPETVPATR